MNLYQDSLSHTHTHTHTHTHWFYLCLDVLQLEYCETSPVQLTPYIQPAVQSPSLLLGVHLLYINSSLLKELTSCSPCHCSQSCQCFILLLQLLGCDVDVGQDGESSLLPTSLRICLLCSCDIVFDSDS